MMQQLSKAPHLDGDEYYADAQEEIACQHPHPYSAYNSGGHYCPHCEDKNGDIEKCNHHFEPVYTNSSDFAGYRCDGCNLFVSKNNPLNAKIIPNLLKRLADG